MNKLKTIYQNQIGLKNFLLSSFALCLTSDLMQIFYAKKVWLSPSAFHIIFIKLLMVNQIDPTTLSAQDIAEGEGVLYMTLWSILFVFVIINAIFYFMYWRRLKWGISYTKFLVITSALFTFLSLLKEMLQPDIWTLFNLLQLIFYIYIWLGFIYFPDLKNSEQ